MFNLTENVSLFLRNQSIHVHRRININRDNFHDDVILILAPFGVLANIFTFYVLTKHRPQTSNTCILRVLSLVDTMVLFMYFSLALQYSLQLDGHLFTLTIVSSQVMQNCSSYVLIVLSLDRCILICYPLHARKWCTIRNARRILSAMLVVPGPYIVFFMIGIPESILFLINSVTLLCAVTILILNTKIAVELIHSARRRALLTAQQGTKPPTGLIVNLSVIVTLYILLSLPSFWFCYLVSFRHGTYQVIDMNWVWYLCNCINSTVNFSVYCFCFKNFRTTVRLIISHKLDHIRRTFGCKSVAEFN